MNQAGALVHVYRDGSVLLAHGGTVSSQHARPVLGAGTRSRRTL